MTRATICDPARHTPEISRLLHGAGNVAFLVLFAASLAERRALSGLSGGGVDVSSELK